MHSVDDLERLMAGRRTAVLTGAGLSTESGIPDYRGPETRRRARNPIQYRQFMDSPAARQRYWARALVGWRRFHGAKPNRGHRAIAALGEAGLLTGVITQNVDRLHHRAGTTDAVELHGALAEVVCISCGRLVPRVAVQERLEHLNPSYVRATAEIAPDGDAELERTEDFVVVTCDACDGPLKPHVVFFGENVPKPRVDAAWSRVNAADALLVVGSSLTVFSGYRFVRGAKERDQPVAILNLGETRGDKHATLKVDESAGGVLTELVNRIAKRPQK